MCIFCSIIDKEIPSKRVYEDESVLAILDISQVTYGHTLVMPKKHVRNITECDSETAAHVMEAVRILSRQILENTKAAGLNVLSNCGEAAGQSVDHLHFHIIPRYDENDALTLVFNESKPQDLDEVLKTVRGE